MQKFILISLAAAALTGCDNYWKYRFGLAEYPNGKSCYQPYQEMTYLENRTSQTQTLEYSYYDPVDDGARKTLTVTVPSGGTLNQKLRDYSKEIPGSHGSDYSTDAYCDGTTGTSAVELNLTANSFASVKMCHVGEASGLVYLVDVASVCPGFTQQQPGPL